MKQYKDLLFKIMSSGTPTTSSSLTKPNTLELFHENLVFDMADGFPLLTLRRLNHEKIFQELAWILSGDTNIKVLLEKSNKIWLSDAMDFYKKKFGHISERQFSDFTKADKHIFDEASNKIYKYGDCYDIYGKQLRFFNGSTDQLVNLIDGLITQPDSRRHMLSYWNPEAFSNEHSAALPSCIVNLQFNVRQVADENYIDLLVYQRSADVILGLPFDIASNAALLHLVAEIAGYKLGLLSFCIGSAHIYLPHIEKAKEMLYKEPLPLSTLSIDWPLESPSLDFILPEMFVVSNYESHAELRFKLFT